MRFIGGFDGVKNLFYNLYFSISYDIIRETESVSDERSIC